MSKEKKPRTPARKKWQKLPKQPVAFMFQPDEYEVVRPQRLSEWEALMRDAVGFPPELVKGMVAARLIETISFRNGTFVD